MARIASTTLQVCALMALAACAATEPEILLVPHSAVAPAGVDFSGTWVIREDESAGRRSINRALGQAGGLGKQSPSRQRNGKELVHVFLETGSTLKITQTQHGFFVSIDRSVVEEFRFGEKRMVNVGEIEGQRVSGWDGDVYTVQTLDKSGMKLIDRFWLSDDKEVLLREITFRGRKDEDASVMQFFDRRDR